MNRWLSQRLTHIPVHPHLKEADWFRHHAQIPGATEELFELSAKVTQYLSEESLFKGFCSGHWHNNAFIDFDGKPSYVPGGLIETLSPISFRLFKTIVAPPGRAVFCRPFGGIVFFG